MRREWVGLKFNLSSYPWYIADMKGYSLNNVFVTIGDERRTVSQWCRIYNITPQCVHERHKNQGWDIVTAITKPVRRYGYNKFAILREAMDGPEGPGS